MPITCKKCHKKYKGNDADIHQTKCLEYERDMLKEKVKQLEEKFKNCKCSKGPKLRPIAFYNLYDDRIVYDE